MYSNVHIYKYIKLRDYTTYSYSRYVNNRTLNQLR